MFERRIPVWLRHAPAPSVRGFATLAAFEAVARGILISVFPVAMYDALKDAALISSIYFVIGIISLLTGLLVPFLNHWIPRRWMYSIGAIGFVFGSGFATLGTPEMIVLGLVLNSLATVITFVCFNAYVLDYISRIDLGKCETLRMFYSALGWTVGPVLGVLLWEWWRPVPFVISAMAAATMLCAFAYQRLGNGKLIIRAQRAPVNPLAFLGRFFPTTTPDCGLAFCGHPLLRVVGLCGLPANFRGRKWPRRHSGRVALVGNQRSFVSVTADAEVDAETFRAPLGSNRLFDLRMSVRCRRPGLGYSCSNGRITFCRQFLSDPFGYLRRVAFSDGGETIGTYRDVGSVFLFPGCFRYPDTRRCVADTAGCAYVWHFCCSRGGMSAGLGDRRAAASASGRKPFEAGATVADRATGQSSRNLRAVRDVT